jgi:hypothetical protein
MADLSLTRVIEGISKKVREYEVDLNKKGKLPSQLNPKKPSSFILKSSVDKAERNDLEEAEFSRNQDFKIPTDRNEIDKNQSINIASSSYLKLEAAYKTLVKESIAYKAESQSNLSAAKDEIVRLHGLLSHNDRLRRDHAELTGVVKSLRLQVEDGKKLIQSLQSQVVEVTAERDKSFSMQTVLSEKVKELQELVAQTPHVSSENQLLALKEENNRQSAMIQLLQEEKEYLQHHSNGTFSSSEGFGASTALTESLKKVENERDELLRYITVSN